MDWSLNFAKTYANVYVFEKKTYTVGGCIFSRMSRMLSETDEDHQFNFFLIFFFCDEDDEGNETDNILAPYSGPFLRMFQTKTYTKKGCMFAATYTSVFSKFSAYIADQYVKFISIFSKKQIIKENEYLRIIT